MRLSEIAREVGGELIGDTDREISGVAPLAEATATDISFADSVKRLPEARESQAGALILPREVGEFDRPFIKVANPRLAFARVLAVFAPQLRLPSSIDERAHVDGSAEVADGVTIMTGAFVGPGARIGAGTILYPNVFVGENAVIGSGCLFYPNVVIREYVEIGNNVIIQPGAVIGADGFGYVTVKGQHHKVPHIGKVIIGDDVEIGANTTIDKATSGRTVVGRGTKIDNLVQVGHNVQIGEDCLIVAMAGLAGSTVVEDRVTMAGQTGAAGHLRIGHDSVVASRGLVAGDLPPGSYVSGFPARPHRENMRMLAAQRKVPDLLQKIRQLERRLQELEAREREQP